MYEFFIYEPSLWFSEVSVEYRRTLNFEMQTNPNENF